MGEFMGPVAPTMRIQKTPALAMTYSSNSAGVTAVAELNADPQ
jgi:hypothetical protein